MRASLYLRGVAALCAVLGVFPLANAMTRGTAVPWWRLAVEEWLLRGAIVVVLAALAAALLGARVDRWSEQATRGLMSIPRPIFAATIALLTFGAAAFYARFCFAGQPFTTDEMAQQWHARILLSGHLSATAEPLREFFNTAPVFDSGGKWFSQYPVGGPAFIAAGMAVRAEWLVNPVLIGLAGWNLVRFFEKVCGDLRARVIALLLLVSPMVLIMAASQMSHVPALAFASLALASLVDWDHTTDGRRQVWHGAIVGASLGVVALVRPLDAALIALVVGVYQLWRLMRERGRWVSVAVQLLAGAIPVAILLWANARTTGHPLLFAYDALNGAGHALGFHVDPTGQAHTPERGLVIVSGYLMRLNRYLFEWPVPAMLFIVAGLVATSRPTRWDVLLASLIVVFVVAYWLYWFDGFFSGPRFLFSAIPAFVYFAARGMQRLTDAAPRPVLHRVALVFTPLCILMAWAGPNGVSSARGRVLTYREQRSKLKTDIEGQVARAGLTNALVFVNEGWRGRLEARLRALGLSQFRADRILNTVDACALETALDIEDLIPAQSDSARALRAVARAAAFGSARLEEGMQADQAIALVPGSRPTVRCLREFQRDTAGTLTYAMVLGHQRVGPDGRVGGPVVFVRDMGERNELLRQRFAGRTWLRYRVPRSLDDTASAFAPY